MSRARTVVGAHIICYINGQPYGRLQNFVFKSGTPRRPIYGIDSMDPTELAVTQTKISGAMVVIRTVGDGGAEGAGITANFDDLPREKYFTVQLIERGSDTVIFQAELCSVTNQTWTIPQKGVIHGTIEFEAISWSNEIHPLGESA